MTGEPPSPPENTVFPGVKHINTGFLGLAIFLIALLGFLLLNKAIRIEQLSLSPATCTICACGQVSNYCSPECVKKHDTADNDYDCRMACHCKAVVEGRNKMCNTSIPKR